MLTEITLKLCPICNREPILTENWEAPNLLEGYRFTCKCENCPIGVDTNHSPEYTAKCWNDLVDRISSSEPWKIYIEECAKRGE